MMTMNKAQKKELAIQVKQGEIVFILPDNASSLTLLPNGSVKHSQKTNAFLNFKELSSLNVSVNGSTQKAVVKVDLVKKTMNINFSDCVKLDIDLKQNEWRAKEFNFTHDRFEELPSNKFVQLLSSVRSL